MEVSIENDVESTTYKNLDFVINLQAMICDLSYKKNNA